MKFVDLDRQRRRLELDLQDRLGRVLQHGQFILGPEVDEVEQALAARTKAAAVVSCANGTDALSLSLRALDIGAGDAVFVPAFTYAATINAVLNVGATPVLIDINADDFQMCAEDLSCALEALENGVIRAPDRQVIKARAVIAVGLFGHPADLGSLAVSIAGRPLLLLEDGAQSLFSRRCGAVSPAQGLIGTTSFFPSKILGCYGDGGAVFCQDTELATAVRQLRSQGKPAAAASSQRPGQNSRLDTLQAAVLLAKLRLIDEELAQRSVLLEAYRRELAPIKDLQLINDPPDVNTVCSLLTIRLRGRLSAERDRLRARLQQAGIPSRIYYETALHEQPAFTHFAFGRRLPNAEAAARSVLSLPFHPYLTCEELARVGREVREILTPL